ncbi:hypothetical protein CRYUN_Cryun05aG0253500 [Craigia yunnanensis]
MGGNRLGGRLPLLLQTPQNHSNQIPQPPIPAHPRSQVSEVSPGRCGRSEEKEGMRHSLSRKFPSVELFKEYQNAAMAILEKSDYTMLSGNPFIKKNQVGGTYSHSLFPLHDPVNF